MKSTFETYLKEFSAERYGSDRVLSKACRYAMEGEGKRVRPLLTLMVYQLFAEDFRAALPFALAMEMIHTYSLVHDDLPCMDDDDLRRGRPTVHKVFGEAIGVLVGDALLTDALEVVCEARGFDPEVKLRTLSHLTKSVGSAGMVLGQAQDMYWTGRKHYTRDILEDIHRRKTGALIGAACAVGALSGGAQGQWVETAEKAGFDLGLAFQIRDDLLDASEGIGKTSGKDEATGKLTYLRFMAAPEANSLCKQLLTDCLDQIDAIHCHYPARKVILKDFVMELMPKFC